MGQGRDYISGLPDELLLHILGFLPTVDAVRTACVSPRFHNLWMSLPNLSFSQCEFHRCSELGICQMVFKEKFFDFVEKALSLHNCPTLDRFSLSLELYFGKVTLTGNEANGMKLLRMIANVIRLWICFALRKKVRILKLDFAGCCKDTDAEAAESEYYVLPGVILRSGCLEELYLDRCWMNLSTGIQLKSLRILSLRRAGLTNEMVNQILSGCPMLEELSLGLEECYNLERLEISVSTRLTKLDIKVFCMEILDLGQSSIEFLKIYAFSLEKVICPTITHLVLDIHVNGELGRFIDLPSLTEATVFICRDLVLLHDDIQSADNFRWLLQKSRNATSFKPCAFCVKMFSLWELTNYPSPVFSWKHVTAVLGFAAWMICGITRILRSTPFLESLVIYAFPFSGAPDFMSGDLDVGNFNSRNYWGSFRGNKINCLRRSLKHVTIQGDIGQPYILDLIVFLLGNALVLEKMVISGKWVPQLYQNRYISECNSLWNPVTPISKTEVSFLVHRFPRASKRAEVSVV